MARPPALLPLKYTVPLRMDEPMHTRMKSAAGRFHSSDVYALRIALAVGLEVLERIDFQISAAIVDRYFRELDRSASKKRKK